MFNTRETILRPDWKGVIPGVAVGVSILLAICVFGGGPGFDKADKMDSAGSRTSS